jgi:hypothetical protein
MTVLQDTKSRCAIVLRQFASQGYGLQMGYAVPGGGWGSGSRRGGVVLLITYTITGRQQGRKFYPIERQLGPWMSR